MKSIIGFMKDLIKRMNEDDVTGMAAELAFFFLLSLFPFLLFLVTLIGYLPLTQEDILSFVASYAPSNAFELIQANIGEVARDKSAGMLLFTLIGTLWVASNGINAIMRSLNDAYNVRENRSFLVSRLIAMVLTVAMVIVIIIAFLLPIFGKAIGIYLFSFIGLSEDFIQMWNTGRWIISSVVFFLVLFMLYLLAPNKRVSWKDSITGAAFATVGWQLVSLAFSYYVSTMGNYSATYGSLGGVIVLMIWFYFSGLIIIIGGQINALVEKRRG